MISTIILSPTLSSFIAIMVVVFILGTAFGMAIVRDAKNEDQGQDKE